MNYIIELNAFHDSLLMNDLSTGQIALWYALMHINNKCNWIEWFSASNKVLSIQTGMSRSGILKARNELKQKGYIDFKPKGTESTLYKIIPMSNSTQDGVQDGKQGSVQGSTQDGVQESNTINKHKQETKHIKKNNTKKGGTKFKNFPEREYDMSELEEQLLKAGG